MPSAEPHPLVAVVLAGGESRRFGSDKLLADLDGRTVLDRSLDGLPVEARIIVVGPGRPLTRPVELVREQPPGGGPAAGLIAGVRHALDRHADLIITLPGDAPSGGRAAMLLAAHLQAQEAVCVIGVDRSGRDQVLQLVLRPEAARQLIDLAGPDDGHGHSVRRLVAALDPPPLRLVLPDELTRDVDTTADLEQLRNPDGA